MADKILLVAKITLVVPETTFKVAVITSSLLMAKITYVVAQITFEVAGQDQFLKNGSRKCKRNNKHLYVLLHILYLTEIKYYVSTLKPSIVTLNC